MDVLIHQENELYRKKEQKDIVLTTALARAFASKSIADKPELLKKLTSSKFECMKHTTYMTRFSRVSSK